MPSGPEGDQGISEHTLMHPKFKRLDFTLVSSCFPAPPLFLSEIPQTFFFFLGFGLLSG